jgi:hypothetical protein
MTVWYRTVGAFSPADRGKDLSHTAPNSAVRLPAPSLRIPRRPQSSSLQLTAIYGLRCGRARRASSR